MFDLLPNEVETVYVSATRSETVQMPIATQIKIISQEEIKLSGAKLLSEILRSQAGLQLTDSDGSGARNVTASMRGLSGANNVLVLVDGRKLNNPTLAGPALNTVALKDVERIEIVQGSAGVLYGDQAVGGVINIITRRAAAGEIDGVVYAATGTDNLEDYVATLNQGFENGLSYRLSAQKRNADNYRDNNQNAYENLLAKVRYDSKKGFAFVEWQTIDDKLRLAGALTEQQAKQNPRQTTRPDDFNNQTVDIVHVGGGFNFSKQWKLQTELSDRDEKGHYFNFSAADYRLRVKTLTPRIIGDFSSENNSSIITIGYDLIKSDYISNNPFSMLSTEQSQEALYIHFVQSILNGLNLNVGYRIADADNTNRLIVDNDKDSKDELNVAELGLNYSFNNQWRIFSRYAENFRFANADENSLVALGTTFLRPQQGVSTELGGQWSGEKSQVSISLYTLDLDDEVTFDSINFVNTNLPDSEREGLIVDANTQLNSILSIHTNYTYTDAIIVAGNYQGKEVPFVSKHTANLGIVLQPISSLSFLLEANHRGSRYKADDEANTDTRLKPLTVFNFNISYDYDWLNLSARVNNITDEGYAGLHSIYGVYPQPERNYEASFSIKF
jgi:iron complex outermembrane recepter protein